MSVRVSDWLVALGLLLRAFMGPLLGLWLAVVVARVCGPRGVVIGLSVIRWRAGPTNVQSFVFKGRSSEENVLDWCAICGLL